MCRLLGVVAASPAPLPELLNGDLEPFIELACEHSDGWGISFIDGTGQVITAKEPVSALLSWTFRPLVERIVTSAAILHLRLRSPGSPRVLENTHPFATAERAFAHNGQFRPVDILDKSLSVGVAEAQGDTDSERYYLAVRDRILAGEAPGNAIAAAAASVRSCAAAWESANCLLLTPAGVCAYADHSAGSEAIKRRGPEYFDLRYRTEPGRVIIASTGWPGPGASWTRLPDRRALVIGRDLALTVNDELAPAVDSG
jgi:predicted glutamine amidotransferase